jgi:hypothetical protein
MKLENVLFLIVASATSLFGQPPDSVQREAINELDWWVGQWKGEAWSSMGPERRDTTLMVETIRKGLDGSIIVVEGQGRRKMPHMEEGDVVHHAFAVLSYDDRKKTYRWQAWRIPGGIYTESWPVVTENKFQWSMETPRGKMRYSIKLNEKGQWEEVGEMSSDGQTWRHFFGMLLTRTQ